MDKKELKQDVKTLWKKLNIDEYFGKTVYLSMTDGNIYKGTLVNYTNSSLGVGFFLKEVKITGKHFEKGKTLEYILLRYENICAFWPEESCKKGEKYE